MKRPCLPFQCALILTVSLIAMAASGAQKAADARILQALAARYPGQQIVASCDGAFLGKRQEAVAALHDRDRFRVVWVTKDGAVQDLESVPAFDNTGRYELQCLDPQEVRQRKDTLRHSEAIHDFLRVPRNRGAFCYFVSNTETKCWSVDPSGRLVEAGGWQT